MEEGRWLSSAGPGRECLLPSKSIIGNRLRARTPERQEAEALLACSVLAMTDMGRPDSYAVGR